VNDLKINNVKMKLIQKKMRVSSPCSNGKGEGMQEGKEKEKVLASASCCFCEVVTHFLTP